MGYGLSKQEMREIMDKVRENAKKLDACKKHEFIPITITTTQGHKLPDRHECVHCGGSVDMMAHYWYMKGREHAG